MFFIHACRYGLNYNRLSNTRALSGKYWINGPMPDGLVDVLIEMGLKGMF